MGTTYGPLDYAHENTILRTVVGSEVHGLAVNGTDDHDEMGIYIEPPEAVLGAEPMEQRAVWRTQPEGARSGPGDTDLVLYSLRRYMDLALKGNPTVLLPLFAPPPAVLQVNINGAGLRGLRGEFLTLAAVRRFVGYLDSQHERMMGGGKRNRVPNRPELVERYGYDTKYASHALRLAYQGWQIVTERDLTLPMPETQRDEVLAVKTGGYSRDEVSARVQQLRGEILDAIDRNPAQLPAEPDRARLSYFMVTAHRVHWGI